jgi:NhaA family Na+:H+ antiporter
VGGSRSGAGVYRFVVDRFLLLPAGALIALVWANTAGESYFVFAHRFSFAVNEVAMALFLALIAHELLEALMPGGALHTWRYWGMPVLAGTGAFAGSAAAYLGWAAWQHEGLLTMAWPVACAIDIAAAYYVLKLLDRRKGPLAFLLLVAVVVDTAGLTVVALRPPLPAIHSSAIMLMAGTLLVAAMLRFGGVKAFWPYIAICGPLSWLALYVQDVHPAFALVPIVPFLPREPRRLDVFADATPDDAVHRGEHEWNEAAQIVLFFFGLVNAGVLLRMYGTGTWAMLAAALVGRPLGILAAAAVGAAAGLRLPHDTHWRDLVVLALATSSGFTFALFFATGLVPMGPMLAEIKLGALVSVAGAAAAALAARLLRTRRARR